ncbi:MAG: DUF3999 family protein [Pseudomonadota bacterium]
MHRVESHHPTAWSLCAALALAAPAWADEAAHRYRAPITLTTPAPFVQLPLPASAYGRSLQAGLQDLRIVDNQGDRVPFTILVPRAAEVRSTEQQRDATLYALPAKPAPGGAWASPIEIAVQGDSLSVKRLGRGTTPGALRSGGWLIDLGERKRGEPAPRSLRMAWSGPQEFSAGYHFESSDDLRSWRAGGAGQLLAFSAPSGALTQPAVMLPADVGRFVRLVWADAAAAPMLTGAKVIAATQSNVAIDAPTELVFSTSPAPAGKIEPDEAAQRALHYDLGGTLPLVQVDLRLQPGTRVAPVRLQGRTRDSEAWRELGSSVFYRLERGSELSHSPPLSLHANVRYLRVLPDARAAALEPAQTQLVVHAALASLVFVAQGQPPYALLAGAEKAAPAALAVSTLVPALDDERARFGRATLGDWSEVTEVARAADRRRQLAALRPWLLWAVLLAGVAGLAFMVWRLTRPVPPRPDAGP